MTASKAKLDANRRYLKTQDEIRIRVPQGEKKRIQEHAASQHESMNAFIVRAIEQAIETDTQS